ncbi:MAG: hypothetical protein R3C03_15710 [Pirellulaceae bacterium]
MPPINEEPSIQSIGNGLKALTEDENNRDDMSTHYVDIKISELIDYQNNLTSKGQWMSQMLATQLRGLPVECSLQVSDPSTAGRRDRVCANMFDEQRVRPGLVFRQHRVGCIARRAIANSGRTSLHPRRRLTMARKERKPPSKPNMGLSRFFPEIR